MFATDFTPRFTSAGASLQTAGERALPHIALLSLALPIGCRA